MTAIFSNKLFRRSNVLFGSCLLLSTQVVACGGADLDVGHRGDELEDEADDVPSPSDVGDDDTSETELPTPQPVIDPVSNTPTLDDSDPTPLGPVPSPATDPNAPTLDSQAPVAPTDSDLPTPSPATDAPTLDSPATNCVKCTGEDTDPSDCQPQCPEPATTVGCGDGVLDGVEECDDGNLDDGDGCSGSCQFEANNAPTFDSPATECVECTGEATDPADCQPACPQTAVAGCGDGVLDGVEECDDGNVIDGDGCSASCQFE